MPWVRQASWAGENSEIVADTVGRCLLRSANFDGTAILQRAPGPLVVRTEASAGVERACGPLNTPARREPCLRAEYCGAAGRARGVGRRDRSSQLMFPSPYHPDWIRAASEPLLGLPTSIRWTNLPVSGGVDIVTEKRGLPHATPLMVIPSPGGW